MAYYISYSAETGRIACVSRGAKIQIGENPTLYLEEVPEDLEAKVEEYMVVDNKLEKDIEGFLAISKKLKIAELQYKCQETISAGFYHEFDGVKYWFSLDAEAQSNFISSYQIMRDDIVQEIPWTVKVDGIYSRLTITKEMMRELTMTIMLHKTNNIAKFRDILSPIVDSASTIEELNAIQWENTIGVGGEEPKETGKEDDNG